MTDVVAWETYLASERIDEASIMVGPRVIEPRAPVAAGSASRLVIDVYIGVKGGFYPIRSLSSKQ